MKSTLFYILPVLILFNFSCKPSVNKEKLAKIDQQISEIDKIEKQLKSLDTNIISNNLDKLIYNVEYIQKNQMDTISMKTAQFLSRYYELSRLVANYRNYNFILDQIAVSKEQMSDLRHDYVHNVLDEEQFEEYFGAETKDFLQLKKEVQDLERSSQNFQEKFLEYNPIVDSIVSSIASQRNNLNIQ